jgi:hypothetical protein
MYFTGKELSMPLAEPEVSPKPGGFIVDDLEEPVTPPVTELNVVEPNVGLIIATVVLVLCL